jgi:hypothetical protein
VLEPCASIEKMFQKTVREKKPKKDEMIAQHSGPVSILKWRDKIGRKQKKVNER